MTLSPIPLPRNMHLSLGLWHFIYILEVNPKLWAFILKSVSNKSWEIFYFGLNLHEPGLLPLGSNPVTSGLVE